LHPTERQWARGNAAKYRDYLEKKTGELITIEVAEQRLLSAGYAITDDAARKTGRSDPDALSFISQYSPSNLFVASGSERADPLLGGNADGSWTPEQQARFGVPKVSQWADDQTAEAQRVLTSNSNCETDVKCGANRVAAVGKAYDALEQVKALYQDNPARVAQITGQQEQLLGQLSPKDMEHAKLASADADLMLDISGVGAVPGALRGTVGLFQRIGVGASRGATGKGAARAVDDVAPVPSGGTANGANGGVCATAASAQNIATMKPLAQQLQRESADSPFAPTGMLTDNAISSAKQVPGLGPGELINPAIPPGFGKYTTDTFQSPAGNFQVHFYKNPNTGEVFYGLDYKAVFNNMSGVPKK
jgi:hypothetical protein